MNLDSETLSRGLVGCVIQQPDLIDDLLKHVAPDDLDHPDGEMLTICCALRDTFGSIDEIAVAEETARVTGTGWGGVAVTPLTVHEIATSAIPDYFPGYLDQMRQGLRLRHWHNAAVSLLGAVKIEDRDHAEHRVHELIAETTERTDRLRSLPHVIDAHELLDTEYPEPTWAIPGLIPAGLTLFAGPPKVGKSAVVLDWALGVALGGVAMSYLNCERGAVLYLSLDNDTERRLQYRLRRLLYPESMPHDAHIDFVTDWATGYQALADCQDWATSVDNPLMVVVDTLVKVEPEFEGNGNQNAYAHSTQVLTRWSKFAHRNNLAVVMVHHDRKSEADDWLNRFSGSRGITATAQTLLMLDAKRGEHTGMLRVSGRDVVTDDLTLHRNAEFWTCVETPRDNRTAPLV
jgi:hypothetical protein